MGNDTGLRVGCISADKVRREGEGELSVPRCLIKGLQGRAQTTRVKITHTLYRAAGIREEERETGR